jgi:cell division protein FtsB
LYKGTLAVMPQALAEQSRFPSAAQSRSRSAETGLASPKPRSGETGLASPKPRSGETGLASPKPRSGEGGVASLRRRRTPDVAASPRRSRLLNYVLVFVTVVLVVDALVGDKGLLDTMRARRQHEALAAALAQKRKENAGMREDIRRLKEDPGAIESLAREELGLMREGEVLFIVRDSQSPAR